MALTGSRPGNQGHLATRLLGFATTLQRALQNDTPAAGLSAELHQHIDSISEHHVAPIEAIRDLDDRGTKLWNLSSKLDRRDPSSIPPIYLVQVFAFLLLDGARNLTRKNVTNGVRVFRVAVRTAKHCLERDDLLLAQRVVERAAYYHEFLSCLDSDNESADPAAFELLSMEYLVLRLALAWKRDRLDLAEILFVKLGPITKDPNHVLTEPLADLLFEIGRQRFDKADFVTAAHWLEKAYQILNNQGMTGLSSEATELHIAIMSTLIRALIALPSPESLDRAWEILISLENLAKDKLIFLLLKLDILDTNPLTAHPEYSDTLLRVIRTTHITDNSLSTIFHYAYNLRTRSPALAYLSFEVLIKERLCDDDRPEWVERALLNCLWSISTEGLLESIPSMTRLLDSVSALLGRPMTSNAAQGAQVLLWKSIENFYNEKDYKKTAEWCRLALHGALQTSDSSNIDILQRRLIACLSAAKDYVQAFKVFLSMSDSARSAPETQYLVYKIGLLSADAELAFQSIQAICGAKLKDNTLLYACVIEAYQTGHKDHALLCMQRLLESDDINTQWGVHLPALFRCTARLLLPQSEGVQPMGSSQVVAICDLFEKAAAKGESYNKGSSSQVFSSLELSWFSQNTYNVALRFCDSWEPVHVLCMVRTCLRFMNLHPQEADVGRAEDLSLRRMFCNFLGGSLSVALARGEKGREQQSQYYTGVRKYAKEFRAYLQGQTKGLDQTAREDLLQKASKMLCYEFEATVALGFWGDLGELLVCCEACKDLELYAIITDIVLTSNAPVEEMIGLVQQIIDVCGQLSDMSIDKLSRWIRCICHQALAFNADLAEGVLNQAHIIAVDSQKAYPAEELEWLASTAFNRAIDFYASEEDGPCKRWAEKALNVALLVPDDGALHRVLENKYLGLMWEH